MVVRMELPHTSYSIPVDLLTNCYYGSCVSFRSPPLLNTSRIPYSRRVEQAKGLTLQASRILEEVLTTRASATVRHCFSFALHRYLCISGPSAPSPLVSAAAFFLAAIILSNLLLVVEIAISIFIFIIIIRMSKLIPLWSSLITA